VCQEKKFFRNNQLGESATKKPMECQIYRQPHQVRGVWGQVSHFPYTARYSCVRDQLVGDWGQVSHLPLLARHLSQGGLPMNLSHANAITVATIRVAKAGKVNC
jgi:hypothetical protein